MKRTDIYQEVVNRHYRQDPTVADMRLVLSEVEGIKGTDYIEIGSDPEDAYITIYRYREETDAEYKIRMEEAERVMWSATRIASDDVTVPRSEWEEMKYKAWQYDQLNK